MKDLAWCEIDGKLVFLDIGKDRYFKLADDQNQVALDRIRRCGLPKLASTRVAGKTIDSCSPTHIERHREWAVQPSRGGACNVDAASR